MISRKEKGKGLKMFRNIFPSEFIKISNFIASKIRIFSYSISKIRFLSGLVRLVFINQDIKYSKYSGPFQAKISVQYMIRKPSLFSCEKSQLKAQLFEFKI